MKKKFLIDAGSTVLPLDQSNPFADNLRKQANKLAKVIKKRNKYYEQQSYKWQDSSNGKAYDLRTRKLIEAGTNLSNAITTLQIWYVC